MTFLSLLEILEDRFKRNTHRHPIISWEHVKKKIEQSHESKKKALILMEETGGEIDVISYNAKTDTYTLMDCAKESPIKRRSLCYDVAALDARKENKPKDSVENMVKILGIELLNEEEYKRLQELDEFDLKTSSWIQTPENIRKLGGALFVIGDMELFLPIIMVQIHTMLHDDGVEKYPSKTSLSLHTIFYLCLPLIKFKKPTKSTVWSRLPCLCEGNF